MDKLTMAHDYFMKHVNTDQYRHLDDEVLILWSFDYVDAMQAEADKREDKTRPESLCEVDWCFAPLSAHAWQMVEGHAVWINSHGSMGNAPSFGFTGSHIMERPDGF